VQPCTDMTNRCGTVEASCASFGEFMATARSGLIPVGDERLRSMRFPKGVVRLDNCGMVDGRILSSLC
jgi:hypothetical protein